MRLLCRHGHFAFYPRTPSDVGDFVNFYGLPLVRDGEFYTFAPIAGAPRYSIEGHAYLNLSASKTFEGRGPWDIFRENNFVFSLATGSLVLGSSITASEDLLLTTDYFVSENALIQPGARNPAGERIYSYDAEFDAVFQRLKIREVQFV